MMTVGEMKALRGNGSDYDFGQRVERHCKELFELNAHGFFDGFEFIDSKLFEGGYIVGDDMCDVILYKCKNRDDGYEYRITVSFDGSVMFNRRVMNIFNGARFGDKFVTENGDVLIYGRLLEAAYGWFDMSIHLLMGKDKSYHVYDSGEYVDGYASAEDSNVVGRLSDDDLDIVKAYVKKELGDKEDDGYMQGFIDGYNNFVID